MEASGFPANRVPLLILGAPLALLLALIAFVIALALLLGANPDCGGSVGGLSDAVPTKLGPIFEGAGARYRLGEQGPAILAAINKVETDFGANTSTSSAGAQGWMQFLPSSWATYGVDGDRDGSKDIADPWDAIFAAARYLHASGAPGNWHDAILAYNHAEWYLQEVLAYAREFEGPPTSAPGIVGCAAAATGGALRILPGANRPGVPIAAPTMEFLHLVAGIAGLQLRVGIGSNHSKYTVDGLVSDHWDGHAADIPMSAYGKPDDDPLGDRIMAACLVAAGDPYARALQEARAGGLYTRAHLGLRIQCIWKTYEGGNHHNHVHIGARPL